MPISSLIILFCLMMSALMETGAFAVLEPTFVSTSYSAAAWLAQQNGRSTTIDNQLIVYPNLLSEMQCQELEVYLDQNVNKTRRLRDISHEPGSIVHRMMKEKADIFSTMMASSLEYYDEVTYAKESKYIGPHYDTLMYGADASHKILIYLDDAAGTNFWPSKEDYTQGRPPTYVAASRGSVVIFSMSLFHSSEASMQAEAAIKRTLGLRATALSFSNMCPPPPSPASSLTMIMTAQQQKEEETLGGEEERENSATSVKSSTINATFAAHPAAAAATISKNEKILIFPGLLSEASCRGLEAYLDDVVRAENRSRGIFSLTKEKAEMTPSYNMMMYLDVSSFLASSLSSSPSPMLEFTDIITYAKETGDYYDKYVGPHTDKQLNDATHKLIVYLDNDVGQDEFWSTEAAYRRMESPYSIVKSSRGQVVIHPINLFHDSLFPNKRTVRRTLGLRVKGLDVD